MKPNAPLFAPEANRELNPPLSSPPWRELLDGLPGMAYRARVDRARTIELASAGCQTLLGIKPEALPVALAPLIHPDDLEPLLTVIATAVANQHSFDVEYRLRHASGEWRTIWEQGHPLHHGEPRVQGQMIDVTQKRQQETALLVKELGLLHARKFQALNQLASGVAHEFNNFIAGILGSAELVAMDLPDNHAARETLKQIFEASNHARDFAHKLRVLAQRQPPDFKPVRLQPVIEESIQILRTLIPTKVELLTCVNPECPKVNADPAQIHQVILDLCLHAWQGLADRRGRMVISLENCATLPPAGAACQLQPGPHVCLTVQEEGPGLDKSKREQIFHPFRNRRAGGTKVGLELFAVRETIQAHLGEILVESQPGSGLTFLIYLPVAAEK